MEVTNHIVMIEEQARIRRKPHIKAKMVARMYIWEAQSIKAIMEHYQLTASEVHSAIAYYYDNQATLDAEYEQAVADVADDAMTLGKLKDMIAQRQQANPNED